MQASGNRLESTTQMAWYLSTRVPRPGACRFMRRPTGLPVALPLHRTFVRLSVHKTVTIGFAGIPNVIEYLAELYIPEQVLRKGQTRSGGDAV